MPGSAPEERVCILTGSGGVLGRAILSAFLPNYRVIGVYRHQPPSSAVEYVFGPLRMKAPFPHHFAPVSVQADITNESEIARIVDVALWQFGRVDLLINAAVVYDFADCFDPKLLERADRQLQVNLLAPLRLSAAILQAYWRHHPRENQTRLCNIIHICSTSGLQPVYDSGQVLYGAAKAALIHATSHMAREYRRFGVRVNCVCPTTFPARIPTARVIEAIHYLDCSSETAQIVELN